MSVLRHHLLDAPTSLAWLTHLCENEIDYLRRTRPIEQHLRPFLWRNMYATAALRPNLPSLWRMLRTRGSELPVPPPSGAHLPLPGSSILMIGNVHGRIGGSSELLWL
jgi:hypothetical protein